MDCQYFLRQLFIASGPWTLCFLLGIRMGLFTILAAQLRQIDESVTTEDMFLLLATHSYGAIPWVIMLSVLSDVIGRKKIQFFICISSLISFIFLYFCTKLKHFFIAELMLGPLSTSLYISNILVLTEFTSPKYRGIFLFFKAPTYFWGVLVANTIGTFFHWQNIIILGFLCSIYASINVLMWPESPLWLVTKGKLKDCATSHRWLKGESDASKLELDSLLKLHSNRRFSKHSSILKQFRKICTITFCKYIVVWAILSSLSVFSGKGIFTAFAITILKKISNGESTAYFGMLILDGITVASLYTGCFLSKIFRRRVILLVFCVLGITTMISVSVYIYLSQSSILHENKYVTIFLLTIYSISTSIGSIQACGAIRSEIIPMESRSLSICILTLLYKLIGGSAALIFKYLSVQYFFVVCAVMSAILLTLVYFFIPETKNKTLQEINDCVDGIQGINQELISNKTI